MSRTYKDYKGKSPNNPDYEPGYMPKRRKESLGGFINTNGNGGNGMNQISGNGRPWRLFHSYKGRPHKTVIDNLNNQEKERCEYD